MFTEISLDIAQQLLKHLSGVVERDDPQQGIQLSDTEYAEARWLHAHLKSVVANGQREKEQLDAHMDATEPIHDEPTNIVEKGAG